LTKLLSLPVIEISDGDITQMSVDVIVNSANPPLGGIGPDLLSGVGGVDGAIHRAAGIELWRHLQALPVLGELEPGWPVRCWPGQCVVTPGFKLPATRIVHGVAPIFDPTDSTRCFRILKDLYERIFETIAALKAHVVAIPPIGTRSYGFPTTEAAEIAVAAARRFVQSTKCSIVFCVIDPQERALYIALARTNG
jgi:O-acetyl-ADP-ribose deacetylase